MTDTKRETAASPNGSALSDLLGLDVMKPAAWEWHDINGDQQVNWHCKPPNASGALYRRAAIDRVLAHAKEVHATSEHMHDRNNALRLYVSDLTAVMLRMVAGIDHLAELARQWEPDHSSGADRRGWVLAKDARDDAWRLLQEHAQRIGPNVEGERTTRARDERT